MSTTVDNRVVSMEFDNRDFEKNVQTSLSTLDKLNKGLDLSGASKGLEDVGTAAKGINISGLGDAVDGVKMKFSALQVMAVTALSNITNSAVNAGKKVVSALTIDPIKMGFQEYETQINAVQTILANTQSKGTTLDDVNGALDELNAYADKTIYNFTEMTRNIGTFTAAGVDLDTSVAAIKGIANLAAVSGSTSQQASTAMYQLSQALSSGTVKLMDWNSVVNAGMGGQVFQDALKETARVHGIAIDDMIAEEGSFRETLSKGWLTSDILTETLSKFTGDLNEEQLKTMGYTDEQIASIIKMGQTANDAATKVKTFTQLFDTLKEAAQSGWTQTWEIIVGDFEEAKELLTEVSDVFGGIIGASANARNEMLKGWKDLGGRTALIEAVKNAFEGIVSVITPIKEAFREIFPPITAEQLYNFTVGLKNLTEKLKLGDEQSSKLKSTFKGLFAIFDILRMAFVASFEVIKSVVGLIFGLGDGVLSATASFGDWVVSVRDMIKESGVFEKAAKKIISAIEKFVATIKPYLVVIGNVIKVSIAVAVIAFKKMIEVLPVAIEHIKSFGTKVKEVFGKVKEFLSPATEAIKKIFGAIKEKFDFSGFETFQELLKKTDLKLQDVGDAIDKFKDKVSKAFNKMDKTAEKSKFVQVLSAIWNAVKTIAGGIVKAFGGMADGIIDGIGNINFDTLLDIITTLTAGGLAVSITSFINSLTEPLKGLGDIVDGVVGVLDGVRGCFEAYQQQLKANALLKIAGAIAILVASILVLSMIDPAKLTDAIFAITTLFAELLGSMAIFNKISGKSSGLVKSCTAMIAISLAVLILSAALKSLSELDYDEIVKGTFGVTSLITAMVVAMKSLSSEEKKVVKGAASMIIFALAIKVLASVCEDLSKLNWEELAKGLIGVGVLLAEVSLFLKTAKFGGKAISTATGIVILSAAIKILASACEDFGSMSWTEIGKGLTSIGALLTMIAAFTKLTGNAKHVISTGISLVLIGAAMKIFASAISDFSSMSWEGIAKGLVAFAGSLAVVTAAVNLMPKNMTSKGVGLVLIASAMQILAPAMAEMGSMSWEEVARGLVALTGSLAAITAAVNLMPKNMVSKSASLVAIGAAMNILSSALINMGGMSWEEIAKGLVAMGGALAVIALGLNAMNGTLVGSAALLVASTALLALAPALLIMGSMSLEAIGKSLLTLAGVFTVLGVAGLVLAPLSPIILALGAALALIAVSIVGLGVGLLTISLGLETLAIAFGTLAAVGTAGATAVVAALTVIVTGFAAMIPAVMRYVGEGLIAILNVITSSSVEICAAVVTIVTALVAALVECIPIIVEAVFELLEHALLTLVEYTPTLVQAVFDILIACLKGIADNISMVVQTAIDVVLEFIDGIAQKIPDVIQSGFDLLLSFINGMTKAIDENTPLLLEAVNNLLASLISAAVMVMTNWPELFRAIGKKLMENGFIRGIVEKFSAVKQTVTDFMNEAKKKIEEKFSKFKSLGKDLISGFINGIKEKAVSLYKEVTGVVSEAVNKVKELLGIHSPSRVFAEIGRYSDEGMIEGFRKYAGKVSNAASDVGDGAITAMSSAISGLTDLINDSMDSEPTIRPVLDLSDVESGTRSINAMFSRSQALRVSANMNGSNITGDMSGAGSTSGNIYQFTQNNYSPKALSRVDIYRQTKNQFSAMKEVLGQ